MSGFWKDKGNIFGATCFACVVAFAGVSLWIDKPYQPPTHTCYEVQMLAQAPDGTQLGSAAVICYRPLDNNNNNGGPYVYYQGTPSNPTFLSTH